MNYFSSLFSVQTSATTLTSSAAATSSTSSVSAMPSSIHQKTPAELQQFVQTIPTDENFDLFSDDDFYAVLPYLTFAQYKQISSAKMEVVDIRRLDDRTLSTLLAHMPEWKYEEIAENRFSGLAIDHIKDRWFELFARFSCEEIEKLVGEEKAKEILDYIAPPKGPDVLISGFAAALAETCKSDVIDTVTFVLKLKISDREKEKIKKNFFNGKVDLSDLDPQNQCAIVVRFHSDSVTLDIDKVTSSFVFLTTSPFSNFVLLCMPMHLHLISYWATIKLTSLEEEEIKRCLASNPREGLKDLNLSVFTDETIFLMFKDFSDYSAFCTAEQAALIASKLKNRTEIKQEVSADEGKRTLLSLSIVPHLSPRSFQTASYETSVDGLLKTCSLSEKSKSFWKRLIKVEVLKILNPVLQMCPISFKDSKEIVVMATLQILAFTKPEQYPSYFAELKSRPDLTFKDDIDKVLELSLKYFDHNNLKLLTTLLHDLTHLKKDNQFADIGKKYCSKVWMPSYVPCLTVEEMSGRTKIDSVLDCQATNDRITDCICEMKYQIEAAVPSKGFLGSPDIPCRGFSLESYLKKSNNQLPDARVLADVMVKKQVTGLSLRKSSHLCNDPEFLNELFFQLNIRNYPLLAINIEGWALTEPFLSLIFSPYLTATSPSEVVIHISTGFLPKGMDDLGLGKNYKQVKHGKLPEARKDDPAKF